MGNSPNLLSRGPLVYAIFDKYPIFRNINEFCSVLQQLPSLEDQLLRKSNKKEAAQSDNKKGSSDLKPGKNVGVVSSSSTDGAIMTEELRKVLVALSSNYSRYAH